MFVRVFWCMRVWLCVYPQTKEITFLILFMIDKYKDLPFTCSCMYSGSPSPVR